MDGRILPRPPDFKDNHLISEADWLTALGEITSKDDEGNEVRYAYCDVRRFEGSKLAELRAFVIRPTDPGVIGLKHGHRPA